MDRRWLVFLLGLSGLLILYELFNSSLSVFLVIIGLSSLYLKNRFSKKRQNILWLIALISLSLALFTSRTFVALLIILILLVIGKNLDFYTLTRESFSKNRRNKYTNDFIMVSFGETGRKPAKLTRNKWLGEDSGSADNIYSWEDINFTKVIGNTVFDLGNTLLPKEQNLILIRKAIGNTKVIIPEGIAVSLDVSILVGNIIIKGEEYTLLNETFKWHTENYQTDNRKIKIVLNVLLGELEVIFL